MDLISSFEINQSNFIISSTLRKVKTNVLNPNWISILYWLWDSKTEKAQTEEITKSNGKSSHLVKKKN